MLETRHNVGQHSFWNIVRAAIWLNSLEFKSDGWVTLKTTSGGDSISLSIEPVSETPQGFHILRAVLSRDCLYLNKIRSVAA